MEEDWQVDMTVWTPPGPTLSRPVITASTDQSHHRNHYQSNPAKPSVFLFSSDLPERQGRVCRESWELFADSESQREENQFTSYQDLVRS